MKKKYYYKENKGIWVERYTICGDILEELLNSEFWDLKNRGDTIKFFIIENLPESVAAKVFMNFSPKKHYIFIAAQRWDEYPGFGADEIKDLLRHELLHVSTGWLDSGLRFKKEAIRRGIEIAGGMPSQAISEEMKNLIKRCYAK